MLTRASIVAFKLGIGGACIGYGALSAARHAPASLRHAASKFRSHQIISDRKDGSRPPLAGIAIAAASAARSATEPMQESFGMIMIGHYIISIATH